jgi:hypothetical protein
MNLIQLEGYTMIDTKDNVRRLPSRNELHVWFPPPGIGDAPEPMTPLMRVLVVLMYAASVTIVCMVLSWASEEIHMHGASAWACVISLIDFSHVYVRPQ